MNTIELEIINWEKYNPRKDIKHPAWFAFNNRMIEDAQFFSFTAEEFKAWIYVLSQASQKNNSNISLVTEHAERVCGIKKRVLLATLEKLEQLRCVRMSVRDPNARVQNPNTTLQTDTTNTTNNNAHSDEFAEFYSGYPRKIGKSAAKRAYLRCRKAGDGHEDLLLARGRFREHHEAAGTEPKFIPYPATFLSDWKQWLDPETGTSDLKGPGEVSIADILADREGA